MKASTLKAAAMHNVNLRPRVSLMYPLGTSKMDSTTLFMI